MEKPFAAYQGDLPYTFVCYAHADAAIVYPEIQWLVGQGINIWYDEGIRAGKNWRAEIGRSLERADKVLFYVSRSSLSSDHCNREINLALDEGREVVPVYLEELPLTPDLKVGLNRVQALHRDQDRGYRQRLLQSLNASTADHSTVEYDHAPEDVARWRLPGKLSIRIWVGLALTVGFGLWYWSQIRSDSFPGLLVEDVSQVRSIAVLEFESGGDAPEYLGPGISQGLIDGLSKLDGVRVIPASTVAALLGSGLDPTELAARFGVEMLVTGRVVGSGDTLRTNVQVLSADLSDQVWGDQFVFPSGGLLELQRAVTNGVIAALALDATSTQLSVAGDPATDSPEAYRLYLTSRFFANQVTSSGLEKAGDYAQRAVALDPEFALAHVAVSQSWQARAFMEVEDWDKAGSVSRSAALAASSLDDSLSQVHTELGFLALYWDWDWDRAVSTFEKALQLDAYNADALRGYAESLMALERGEEALAAAKRSVAAEPLNPVVVEGLAQMYFHTRRYDAAIETFEQVLDIEPDQIVARAMIPLVHLAAGHWEMAAELEANFVEWTGRNPDTNLTMAWIYAAQGDMDRANTIFANAEIDENSNFARMLLARALANLGDFDRAFEVLERMVEDKSRGLLWFKTWPGNDVFRKDLRYDTIVERMGLPAR